ncbi:membrane fusion protein (multidrug efflux system) [Roseiarcus fermentans]|uniref:Membrane fusion protein (Multidrug efflux system) n=1 Tax=Roseiarcus fermentans TaxID=1473586 RepID=A0A366EVS3_9HYPH|nr:HlyD family secretion protein [Roseiarcus fermentans]RBP06493.1 membrane fusion protein (multidrug efflux system) [Roseiarcus fermentans]
MNDQSVTRDATQVARTTSDPPTAATDRPGRRWLGAGLRLSIVVLAGAVAIVVARTWDDWVSAAALQATDDAYLAADTTPLAAKVPGYVRRMLVKDFQAVKAGDLLVELVDDDYRAEVAQAEANVASANATLDTIAQQKVLQRALIEQAEATIKAAEADVIRYRLEAKRQQALLETRLAGTPQATEQAVDNAAHSEATLALNRAQLDQQRQQLNVFDSQERQAKATLAAQTAARDLARINLGYTRIAAPADGMVGQRLVQAGQYLSVGTEVLSLVPLPDVWVIANYKETQMTHVRAGQSATVTVDALPGVTLPGRVDSWSPASGAVFSLLPPDNATGNFTKIVQRIPVKIVLDRDPALDDLLRPGMSVIATIDTGSRAADGRAAAR